MGHARTFLAAWIRAEQQQGDLVLRIEDLDTPRVVAGAEATICRDLEWLGLTWESGPVRQSELTERYQAALAALRARNLVYPCTCSRREIAALATAPHADTGLGDRYPGTCRPGPQNPERTPSQRFVSPDGPVQFHDAILGTVATLEAHGDFVIQRADGVWAYQLAVAVDDAAMGVTEVVRGVDLLASTPRQVALLNALDQTVPTYLHIPLLHDDRGIRLSKRHGARPISSLREAGWTAEQLIGHIAQTFGIGCGQPLALAELAEQCSLERFERAATQFDSPLAR